MNNKKLQKTIGIDLGTSMTCVSHYDPATKQFNVIDMNGSPLLPSVVTFEIKNGQAIPTFVGAEALNQAIAHPTNTIFNSKRFFALTADDIKKEVPAGAQSNRILTYKTLEETAAKSYRPVIHDGKLMIELTGPKGEKVYISSVDVAVAILQYTFKQVLQFFDVTAEQATINAVITVPAYFNHTQRKQVEAAGQMAGFNVLRIINEPTSAALSRSDEIAHVKNLLVVDLGGGTFDVSMLQTDKEGDAMTMEVKCTEGHLALGGSDFDNAIANWILSEAEKLHLIDINNHPINLRNSREAMARLMELSEKVKKILTDKDHANINLSMLDPRISSQKNLVLTRSKFEQLIEPQLKEIRDIINEVLKECNIDKNDITMLATGGSSRVPKVLEVLRSFGIKLLAKPKPDFDVSYGASKLASGLVEGGSDVLLIDVTSMSLGIETVGGVFTPIIKRNTAIPTKQTQVFSTAADNQTAVTIRVFQGERAMAKDNRFLDQFELSGIPPAPRGTPQIEVTFALDANGIVNISASEKNTGKEAKLTVNSSINDDELKKMQENAERFKAHDEQMQKNITLRNTADNKVYEAQKMLKEHEAKLDESIKTEVQNAIKAVEEELQKSSDAENMDYTTLENKSNELSNVIMKIYENMSKQSNAEQTSAESASSEQPKE